jgi:hypothetical protein
MPDVPIEGGDEHDYSSDMEPRVRVLEEIATSTKVVLAEIRADQRAMRAEMMSMEQRRERDFRITFGAIITTAVGLAYLIAHTAHWL